MSNKIIILVTIVFSMTFNTGFSQGKDDELGAWYMYFFDTQFENTSWGLQGDLQYRNWNLIGDLEQLLIRGGVTYRPENTKLKLTLGAANITSGEYGEMKNTSKENRIYQEVILPVKIGGRFYFNNRFRYEQRFVENQNFRTRFRYNLFLNIPLNKDVIIDGTIYISLYNELFINGEKEVSDNVNVEIFDRNRSYLALGYAFSKDSKVQFGIMKQISSSSNKNQLQVSFHHNI